MGFRTRSSGFRSGALSAVWFAAVAALLAIPPALASPSAAVVRRLELVVETIQIHDDSDPGGSGEWRVGAVFAAEPGGPVLNDTFRNRRATAGQAWTVNRVLTPLAVSDGQHLRIQFTGVEEDGGLFDLDDPLGTVFATYDADNGWGLGEHRQRSTTGAYTAEYTIRPAEYPDLVVTDVSARRGTTLLENQASPVCVVALNRGRATAREFRVTLGTEHLSQVAQIIFPSLAPGEDAARCAELTMPAGGRAITAVVDALHVIDESDESNNVRTETLEWHETYEVPPDPG